MNMEMCHHGRFDELNCCNLHWLSICATIEAIISLQIEGKIDRTIEPITWQSGKKTSSWGGHHLFVNVFYWCKSYQISLLASIRC
jgi:hypothetical protein